MIIAITAGRIVRDAELRTIESGTSVCSFTVAAEAGYGDKKRTEFVKIALFGKRAEGLHEYLTKGTALTVEGSAKSNSWISKSGEAKGEIEIVADKLTLQGSKQGSNESQSSDDVSDNTEGDDIPF
jgi:single-strand DNA-binding protein